MFTKKGESIGQMQLCFNKKGGAFYCWEAVPLFIFCDSQYWGGIATSSKTGALMYKESEDLKLAGNWRKQEDGSIFIQSAFPEKAGLILIPSIFFDDESGLPDAYDIFWAQGSNGIESLLVSDNPI